MRSGRLRCFWAEMFRLVYNLYARKLGENGLPGVVEESGDSKDHWGVDCGSRFDLEQQVNRGPCEEGLRVRRGEAAFRRQKTTKYQHSGVLRQLRTHRHLRPSEPVRKPFRTTHHRTFRTLLNRYRVQRLSIRKGSSTLGKNGTPPDRCGGVQRCAIPQ